MKLEDLGYNQELESYRKENGLESLSVGRVISEHRDRYVVKNTKGDWEAELLGNLRFAAESRADLPAVGDWVAISEYDRDKVLIHSIFPRKSILQRQAIGKKGERQIIATNIDAALIVQAVDRDFSINRFERYVTICNASDIQPVLLLNKIDLVDKETLSELIQSVRKRVKDLPFYTLSNQTKEGVEILKKIILPGKTYCLLGSSGVGKSSLLNTLAESSIMKTDSISEHSNRGQHVTTHRELRVLESGGIIIDNPGMREVGITESAEGLEMTFEEISQLARECKYKDCSHISEIGCAVKAAVEKGELDESTYQNYLRMEREREHFESTVAEKRKKDKEFGKMVKHFKNIKKDR